MAGYELCYIIPGSRSETEINSVKSGVEQLLQDAGVVITRTEDMGRRRLAYPIRHEQFGHYALVLFEAEGDVTTIVRGKLTLSDTVLRFEILRRDLLKVSKKRREQKQPVQVAAPRVVAEQPEEAPIVIAQPTPKAEESGALDIAELDRKLDELLERGGE